MTADTGSRLDVLSAVAVHAEIERLVPQFMSSSKLDVRVRYDVNPAVARRVLEGETFDVGLTNPWYVDEMISQGKVVPDVHVPFGRIPLAIGALASRRETIANTSESIRALLIEADSIAYTSIGTSGKNFLRALEQMNLRDTLYDRLRAMGAGEPVIAAAAGDVQYAIAPLSRIIAAHGVDAVATFPADLGLNIDMSMFISVDSENCEKAKRLIQFLSDPALNAYLSSNGVSRFEL